jgi:hypothetical protein
MSHLLHAPAADASRIAIVMIQIFRIEAPLLRKASVKASL